MVKRPKFLLRPYGQKLIFLSVLEFENQGVSRCMTPFLPQNFVENKGGAYKFGGRAHRKNLRSRKIRGS